MEQLGPHWKDFDETGNLRILSKVSRENSSFIQNLTRIMGTVHEYLHTVMIISCWILFRMAEVSNRTTEIIKTHVLWTWTDHQLNAQFYLFNNNITSWSSTCFQHRCAHLQEDSCIFTVSGIVTPEKWMVLCY
jgi:hypothetical protein